MEGTGQIISRQPSGNACSWQPRLAGRIMAQNRARASLSRACTTTPVGQGPGWWEAIREAACLQVGPWLLPSPQHSCASGDCGSSPKMLMEMLKYEEILRMRLICEALRLSALRILQGILPSRPKKLRSVAY